MLSGSVHIVKEDFWGRRHLLSEAGEGNFFAEAYASLPGTPLSVSVLAAEDSSLLFVNVSRLLDVCPSSCPFHQTLIRNVLSALAGKNLMLTEKDGAAVPPLHPRKAPGLPVGCFRPGRLQLLFHPIQQTAACRLPLHRPERSLFGAWPAEAGRRA